MTTDDIIRGDIPWQATVWGFTLNLRDKKLAALQAKEILDNSLRKELTKEACYMIFVILAFILLAIVGSSITVYDAFFDDNGKRTNFQRINYNKTAKRMTITENGKMCLENHCSVWLDNCKYFLKFFCIVKNGSKIISTAYTEGQVASIHGLRFVANAWIILLHTNIVYMCSLKDLDKMRPILEPRASQLILSGLFSVDIFFVISGFLNAYTFFHKLKKLKGSMSWLCFYFKRFIRLTPVYMIVLFFYATLFTYMGNGITWPTYNTNPVCKQDWWRHLLYINNFEESAKECMAVYWYLAADMQFYIISPLFMILLKRWPRFGYALVFACICGSCAASFMLTYQYNLIDGISRLEFHLATDNRSYMIRFWEYFDAIHEKPYARIGQNLVGLTLGHYLYEKNISKKVIRNNKMTLICGWIATATFMWIYLFSLHKRKEELFETALYNGTKYLFSSCGLAWIIYACFTEQSDFLNRCLSWKALLPFSRLSYCAYLIHPIILIKQALEDDSLMDFNVKSLMLMYLYTYFFTYIISFAASILFEQPFLNLLEWLGKKNEKKILSVTDSDTEEIQNVSDIYKIS